MLLPCSVSGQEFDSRDRCAPSHMGVLLSFFPAGASVCTACAAGKYSSHQGDDDLRLFCEICYNPSQRVFSARPFLCPFSHGCLLSFFSLGASSESACTACAAHLIFISIYIHTYTYTHARAHTHTHTHTHTRTHAHTR